MFWKNANQPDNMGLIKMSNMTNVSQKEFVVMTLKKVERKRKYRIVTKRGKIM